MYIAGFIHLYTTEYVHIKAKYKNDKYEDVEDDLSEGYFIHLHHQPAIEECSAENVIAELKRVCPTIVLSWMSESTHAHVKNRKSDQHILWTRFQNEHFIEFPNAISLCQMMITTPANTSPLERSYTELQ